MCVCESVCVCVRVCVCVCVRERQREVGSLLMRLPESGHENEFTPRCRCSVGNRTFKIDPNSR